MKITSYDRLKEKLDSQLKKIEELADKKAEEIERNNFLKYRNLFEIAMKVMKKYNVLLYGGTALNELLPERLKFYKPDELPDIDVFCTESVYKKLEKELLTTFIKKGYSLTTIKEALHEKTYKLMVQGLQLIDISVLPTDMFRFLEKGKQKTSFQLYTVNTDFLKFSLHIMLSQPLDAHRWPKVFQRLVRLYEVYPLEIKCKVPLEDFYLTDIPESLEKNASEYAISKNMVAFGWDVITTYLKEDTSVPLNIKKAFYPKEEQTPVQYFVVSGASAKKHGEAFVKHLENKDVQMVHSNIHSHFLPDHVVLTYKGEKWIYLFESTNCSSYQVFRGRPIFSIHGVIQYLYLLYFATQDSALHCIIQMMILLQMNNSLSTKKIFQQFILDCYGYQKGLVTLRKERFLRIKQQQHQ